MRVVDFFSGIGGFRLGLERSGHEVVASCEIAKAASPSSRHTSPLRSPSIPAPLPAVERWIGQRLKRAEAA